MKRQIVFFLVLLMVCESWSIPKPMESVTNYNVIMLHGALGSDKGFKPDESIPEAIYDGYRGSGHIGKYGDHKDRVTYWLSQNVLEEPDWSDTKDAVRTSSMYAWRAFTNPANSSKNNAVELGDRTWNKDKKFGGRRALVEEAQEVKAWFVVDPNDTSKNLHGQVALDSMRNHPDLYRQLASRNILIGHSMGGVVSREWVQNSNYYHGEVGKVITLDCPHEGTGALNMQLGLLLFCSKIRRKSFKENRV